MPEFLKSLAAALRANRQWLAATGFVAVIFVFVQLLSGQAAQEAKERKTELVQQFEKEPDAWLKNPRVVSEFQKTLDAGELASVAIASSARSPAVMLLYTLRTGEKYSTYVPGCTILSCRGTVIEQLADKSSQQGFQLANVTVDWRTPSRVILDGLDSAVSALLPLLALAGVLYFIIKAQSSDGSKATHLAERPDITFDDVIGAEEAKAALLRVKTFLTDPQHYANLQAKPPRGILIKGPPGTGKTLLAKALAGECQVKFIAVDGSYFTSMFYGMGVMKVRALFKLARKHAPCILFIDEMDGIGRRSSGDMRGGESELNRIINRMLTEMDGFGTTSGIIVIGATNHPENLDPAMLRAGRFDMDVAVSLPTVIEREKLFRFYANKVPKLGELDCSALARMTAGMSPADIANTVNKAAASAAEQRAPCLTQEHLLQAIETKQMGGEVARSTMRVITEETRRRIAYHEAGHALVAHLTVAGKVERVSIESRGSALGVTYITRESEEPLYKRAELTSRLAMMLAGRESELLVFGDVSSGASDDLKRASELAVNMVAHLGFSEAFGLLSMAGVPKELVGPDVQASVLKESRELLEKAQGTCADLLTTYRSRLEALAAALLAMDIVSGAPLQALLDGREGGVERIPQFEAYTEGVTHHPVGILNEETS